MIRKEKENQIKKKQFQRNDDDSAEIENEILFSMTTILIKWNSWFSLFSAGEGGGKRFPFPVRPSVFPVIYG